jgi:RHS repeat-associated protein
MIRRLLCFLLALNFVFPALCAADQVYFYHTDPAGTPLAMTDSSGAVVWKADYKPFGEENSTAGAAANDRRFVGKEKDEETGLSYFGARYEDAKAGRFIAPDPVRAVDPRTSKTNEKLILNPQRLNTYAYALNNPYRYVDPDGHNPVLIGLGIIWLGEMVMPQTMGSSQNDSFIGRHWGDLLMLPLGIEREAVNFASSSVSKGGVEVSEAIQSNFARFVKKVPANSKSSAAIEAIEGGGYRFTATSPGEVPGSKAIYEKTVDAAGKTTNYIKTTIDPKGQIVHIKNKMGQ